MRTILMLLTPREVSRVIRTCSFHFRSQNRDQRKINYEGWPPSSPPIGFPVILEYGEYDGVSNFSYEYFDIKDKQKLDF